MKKKVLSAILCIAMVATMLIGCTTESPTSSDDSSSEDSGSEGGGKKIGITIQNIENAYWAGVMSKLQEILDENGYEATIMGCEENASTQISQIENFITSGCDLIMVHPHDADAVEASCKSAMDAGIKVMCWDNEMENTTANWVLDNTELGKEIGKTAANFINEHFTADNKAEVCVIGKPDTQVLLERQQGIEAGLEENCEDNYEIVATIEGVVNNEVQSQAETVLQAHPDCKVWVGVGAGAMIGSNTALLAEYGGAGNIPEDVGVITTDVTSEQLDALQAGDEAVRAIVGFEGSNTDTAQACFEMFEKILNREFDDVSGDEKNVYRPTMEINMDNIEEIQAGM